MTTTYLTTTCSDDHLRFDDRRPAMTGTTTGPLR